MMKVTVKLYATLTKGRFDREVRKFPVGTLVKQVMSELKITKDQAAIIFVNNRHAMPNQELFDRDILSFFPPIGGG